MNRRTFFPAAFLGLLATTALTNDAGAAEMSDSEKANVETVRDMVAAWDLAAASNPPDASRLSPFFSDDCAFRLRPTDLTATHGMATVEAALQRGTANGQKVRHELLENFAKGPVVVMEKLNQFITPEKTRTSHVVAVFLLKDGKIVEWTEYFISAA
jgi:limonene-1,2-epoxide hydrolase